MQIRVKLGFAVLASIVTVGCSGGEHPTEPTPIPVAMCTYPGLSHLKASDPGCVPPPPNPTLDISLSSVSGLVGDTVSGVATASNSTSCVLTATGATLILGSNCGPFKATLNTVGTASITGTATGVAGTQAASVTKNITVSPKPVITFTGKIVLMNVQSGDTPKGWTVSVLVAGEEKVSTTSGDDGSYTLPAIKAGATRNTVIKLVPPSGSRYFPEYLETTTSYVDVNMKWPAIPKCWVIEMGVYAGQCIDVNLPELLSGGSDIIHFLAVGRLFPNDMGLSSQGFGYYNFRTWARTDDLPVRVAFSRDSANLGSQTSTRGGWSGPTSVITSDDSISFWRRAEDINRVTGRTYVVPATKAEVLSRRRGVLVWVDSLLDAGGMGSSPGLNNPSTVTSNQYPLIGNVIIQDHIWFTNPDIDTYWPTLVRHELLHSLGLGHTTLWNSVMNPIAQSAGSTVTLSPKDAAYLEMITEMGYAQKANFTLLGFAESFNGDRVITQGLPPSTNSLLP